MTEDEIDKMSSGKNMDALVAEWVMGWKNMRFDPGGYHEKWTTWPKGWYGDGPHGEVYLTYEYSSNWGAMRYVVNQFRYGKHEQANGADSVACVIEMVVSDWDSGGEDCECKIYSPTLAPVTGTGNQMPLAVCRAALKVALFP